MNFRGTVTSIPKLKSPNLNNVQWFALVSIIYEKYILVIKTLSAFASCGFRNVNILMNCLISP